jgi:sugar lactone lactonase YvrE
MIASICSVRPFVCPPNRTGFLTVWTRSWIAGLLLFFPLLSLSAGAQTTTISGTVYMPNGTNVLPGALVYVTTGTPAALVSGANCPGVNCLTASTAVPSGVTIYTYSAVDGTFTLSNVSQSTTYTLVIQAGHWRRQFSQVVGTSAITALSLSMPSTHAQGDIPLIAIATGSKDAVECVFHDLGVNNNELTDDTVASGATFGGRIHLYKGDHSAGAEISASTPLETALMGGTSTTPLGNYDMVMFPCQGSTTAESAGNIDNLLAYTSAGGRAFVTHDSRVWLNTATTFQSETFSGVANWLATPVSVLNPDPGVATVNTSFTDGSTLAQWLYNGGYADGNTGAADTGTLGQVEISTLRWDLSGVNAPTQSWLTLNTDVTTSSNPVMQFSFNTPFGADAAAQYGRVLFNEYHVENVTETGNPIFPAECPTLTTAEIAQEKMLEYALFDLSNFVVPIVLPTVSIAITTNPSDSVFMEGDTGDTITVAATDTSETVALSNGTTLSVTLPAGLTATAMTDADGGWICTVGTLTCTRTTTLAAGATDSVLITVSVAANATGGDPSTTTPVSAVVSNPSFSSSVTVPLTLTLQQHAAVTWATPAAIADGTPLSSTQLNAVGNTAGTYVYSPPAGTVFSPGSHLLAVTFTPTDQDSYPGTGTASVTLVVNGPVAATASAPVATNFGPIPVGTASSSQSVTFTFLTAGVIGAPVVETQGATGLDFAHAATGTCDTNGTSFVYGAEATCTVNVILTPRYPGTRYGAVLLEDGSGAVLATAYVYGIGTGPQVAFTPAAQSVVVSGLLHPDGVAVDASGNLYIADANNSRVLKETLSAGAYTQSVLVSGLSTPAAVAVDGSGDVYIADSGDGLLLKETPSGGNYVQTLVGTGLTGDNGVAVDGSGNVYIADSGNNRVLLETLSGGTYTQTPIGSDFSTPQSVAVDGSGNVYVADSGSNRILEETLTDGTYTQSPLFTGLNNPLGVAVDGVGNVYIANASAGQVLMETLSGESYTQTTLASGLSLPQTMVVDGSGNVFITDSNNNQVLKENVAAPPNLSFASTHVGLTSSDSPKAVTVKNIGNGALVFTASGLAAPADFSQVAGSGSPVDCVNSGSVVAGAACNLSISFVPTTVGVLSESFTLADNSLNASPATQTIALDGTGVSSITLSPSSSALAAGTVSVAYGSVTFTATGGTAPYLFTHTGTLPPGLTLSGSGVLSGTPTAAGGPFSFTVVATDSESSTGSNAYSIAVNLGMATVTLGNLAQVYTGSPLAATATTNPAGLTVVFTYTGTNGTTYGPSSTPPTSVGSYTVVGTVSSENNSGTASGTLVIATASATVTLGGLVQPFSGSPLAASAVTIPAALTVVFTYTGSSGTTYGPSSTPPTSAGSYAVVGTVSNANYSGVASGTMVVGRLASATSVSSSATPALAQTALTFIATVSAPLGMPSGTVTFLDGTTPLGQASLTGHTASLVTSSLAAGSHTITADYSGDTDFAGSASSPLTQSILDFGLASTSGTAGGGGTPITTQTANPGGTATYPLTIVPTAGISFPTPIVLTVAGMPPGATAVITPSPWTQLTGTTWSFPKQTPLGPLSLAIQLPSPVAHLDPRNPSDRKLPVIALAFLLLPFAGRFRALRKRLSGTISLLLLALAGVGAMAALSGCGATSGLFADQAKTYTVTVTATSGTLSHATSLTLTVK